MTKEKTFYPETRKALDIYEKHEQDLKKTMPREDKLKLINEAIEDADSREELEKLEAEKKELEISLKVDNPMKRYTLSEDVHQKLQRNYDVENQAALKWLDEKYSELATLAQDFSKQAETILSDIADAEEQAQDANRITWLLDGQLFEFPSEINGMFNAGNILSQKHANGRQHYINSVRELVNEVNRTLSDLKQKENRIDMPIGEVVNRLKRHQGRG